MTIELVPVAQLPFPAFVDVFNRAYEDYFIPIYMEVDNMNRLVKRDQIDLQASVIALEDGLPVGVGMLAVNQHKGWIGGLGVVPTHRRLGLGRRITEQLISNGAKLGLQEIYLEVIEKNLPASTLYQKLNFEPIRRLLVVDAPAQDFEVSASKYQIQETTVLKALSHYSKFHALPNPWQRRFESLVFLQDSMGAWVIEKDKTTLAYVVGWVWDDVIRFMDIGMAEGGEEALSILLKSLHNLAPEAPASISNLPENEATWGVMQALNYQITISQQEMLLRLG